VAPPSLKRASVHSPDLRRERECDVFRGRTASLSPRHISKKGTERTQHHRTYRSSRTHTSVLLCTSIVNVASLIPDFAFLLSRRTFPGPPSVRGLRRRRVVDQRPPPPFPSLTNLSNTREPPFLPGARSPQKAFVPFPSVTPCLSVSDLFEYLWSRTLVAPRVVNRPPSLG